MPNSSLAPEQPDFQPARRRFLAGAAALGGTLWATSTALVALAPSCAWALPLGTLDAHTAQTVLAVTRHIFPHAKLDDAVYALVVKALDDAAKNDPALSKLLHAGVVALDAAASGEWLALPPAQQLAEVTRIAGQPFFEKIRSTAVVALYNNDMAFAHFGYEGESFTKGGYLNRGFNDLQWLPAPAAVASPAKWP